MATIGTVTTYHGTEHAYLRGHQVKIVAVIKAGLDEHGDIDPEACDIIETDEDLARFGGVAPHDRVEVAPWIAAANRYSFATSDPLACDLALFADLN